MATSAQITANQLNAQSSTGPVTQAGKEASKNNALRHGLTSKQLLLPGEDPAQFEGLHNRLIDSYGPKGEAESAYVAQLAEHEWRLTRARRVETATLTIYLNRYLAESEGDYDTALALAFDRHRKEIDCLRRYEHAITRAFDRILEKLAKLIKVRYMLEANAPPEEIGSVSQSYSKADLDAVDNLVAGSEITPEAIEKGRELLQRHSRP